MYNQNSKIEIYVATHKKFELPVDDPIYIPIQGGADLYPELELGYLKDNIGDNISNKKEYYNELTSFYWAWRNSIADIKGLCHYRRFFYKSDVCIDSKYIITAQDICTALNKFDIILPIPYVHRGITNYDAYSKSGVGLESDLLLVREIINEKYCDYLSSFDVFMSREYSSLCNSFIASSETYDKYAEWLFSILFILEQRIDVKNRKGQQIRVFGFLAERLINVWVMQNKLTVKYFMLNRTDRSKNANYYLQIIAEKMGLFRLMHNGKHFVANLEKSN